MPVPEMVLFQTKLRGKRDPGYWGMDGSGDLVPFMKVEWMSGDARTHNPLASRAKIILGAGTVIAGCIGIAVLEHSSHVKNVEDEDVPYNDSIRKPTAESKTESPILEPDLQPSKTLKTEPSSIAETISKPNSAIESNVPQPAPPTVNQQIEPSTYELNIPSSNTTKP
jgi:hypothetical protein